MPLSLYTPFPVSAGTPAYPDQLPEILLYNTTLASGTASLTLNNTAFSFATYNRIHVRVTGATFQSSSTPSGWWYGVQGMKSGANITGTHYYSYEGTTSATATGWATSSVSITTSPFALLQSGTGLTKTSFTPQLDIYIDKYGIEALEIATIDATASPAYHKRGYLSFPTPMTTSDYAGLILNLQAGAGTGLTWASGTVNVYGVK